MGGAVQAIAKPIFGGGKSMVETVKDVTEQQKPVEKASRSDEEQAARRRGARRRGAMLMSDARLNEGGTETLGGGNSLG